MGLTPVEIRHLEPARTWIRGYRCASVDTLLDEIVVSFEDVWRERADFADKIEQLEADLVRFRELEALLRTTLISAEKAAVTLKEQAGKQADLIVEEARADAAVVRLIAETVSVSRDAVSVVSGVGSRDKIVELAGIDLSRVERRLTAAAEKERP